MRAAIYFAGAVGTTIIVGVGPNRRTMYCNASMDISAACRSSRKRMSGFPAARRVSVRASSSKTWVLVSGPCDPPSDPPVWANFESPVAAARIGEPSGAHERFALGQGWAPRR